MLKLMTLAAAAIAITAAVSSAQAGFNSQAAAFNSRFAISATPRIGSTVAINPQPLPPKISTSTFNQRTFSGAVRR